MLGDLVGVSSSTVGLYVGTLIATLRTLVGVTIPMGAQIGGDVDKDVESPGGSVVVGEYVDISIIDALVGFFNAGAFVGYKV